MQVLLVHGFLAPRALFWPLAGRLRRLGHRTDVFVYPSHREDLDTHAEALAARVREAEGPTAVVAHSLGGLVLHRAVALDPTLPLSRRVFIATPHRGCRVGRRARRSALARLLPATGKVTAYGCEPAPHAAPVGVVIGTRDLLVRPDEADLPGATARLTLPFGHNELLVRPQLAHAMARFLRTGATFDLDDALATSLRGD